MSISPILQRNGILAFIEDEGRQQLATYGRTISIEPGKELVREGEVNTSLYVILSGTFDVATKAMGSSVHLDSVGPGDCLGEVALFDPDDASATVTCRQPAQVWAIDATRLQEFLVAHPDYGCAVVLGINIILSRRLKRANEVMRLNEIVPAFLAVRSKKRRC